MNTVAVIIFVVWAVGIPLVTAGIVHLAREEPWLGTAFDANPVGTCLFSAILAVMWPASAAASLLSRLSDRGRR
ncbi:hypothetical protein [Streptomyces sulphureus]|uniref:hypothetical protein n=1 Tax=Streptomyces sulphureus TaxID=47758 RepID=UPI0003698F86|nr:hypothetical protein [Streptomyces sulphureus]